ncbi:hypothetical protein GALL_494560 [mine drainage metagenome]|uniref:Uncharacterized protein n=1 Tax=mine drainage metagenome TaxID=410659 RepID=A0A1J5PUI5_9ZZZZ
MQVIDRIDLGLGTRPPVQHIACGLHLAVAVAVIGEQEELQLERCRRAQPLDGQGIDLTLQRMARVRGHQRAIQMIHRHEHLVARRCGAMQRHQRARNGPSAQIAIALIPDQPGFMHILAANIEAQDRDRQMPPAGEERHQFVAPDDLAAPDAIGVVQHDIKRFNLGMGGQKGLGLGRVGTGGAGGFAHVSLDKIGRKGFRRRQRSTDQSAAFWWPGKSASCCGTARSDCRD